MDPVLIITEAEVWHDEPADEHGVRPPFPDREHRGERGGPGDEESERLDAGPRRRRSVLGEVALVRPPGDGPNRGEHERNAREIRRDEQVVRVHQCRWGRYNFSFAKILHGLQPALRLLEARFRAQKTRV